MMYAAVDDIEATIKKIEGLGGKITGSADGRPHVGKLQSILDPQGAAFALDPTGSATRDAGDSRGAGGNR